MPAFPFLDAPPLAFAHRGGEEAAPENTVRAFGAAVSLGYRYLETDVHVSADGGLLAFHDDRLDRVTDAEGSVEELTTADLEGVRIAGTDPIPTLDELLETFPDVHWNIDAKSDRSLIALGAAIRRHGAIRRVNVAAFSDERLRRMRSLLGPELCTAAGPREIAALVASARLPALRSRRHRAPFGCVQVPVS
ncbi:MAG: glycerophosphodiester phosphodiesterase, partial [Actinobacteria bacterium]|nr:glycerophosphodiester phosphodiesterase [Actinomycetota bacterium]